MPSVGEALTAPYIGRAQTVRLCLGLTLERALACTLDARSLKCGLFWERCLTGKKIPNVVGFGTFPNVVGLPSSRTVSRIEAALPGGLFCAFCGGGLDCALFRKARLRLGLPLGRLALGRVLDPLLDAPWLAPWVALRWGGPGGNRAWGLFCERRRFASRARRFLTLSGSELSLTLSGSLLCEQRLEQRPPCKVSLTVPSLGLGSALRRKGPGCALDCLLDAPWLGPRLGVSLGLLLGLLWGQECAGAGLGESSLVFFLGTVSFCLTGKKIPNVVGLGTFPNVVGLRTFPNVLGFASLLCEQRLE